MEHYIISVSNQVEKDCLRNKIIKMGLVENKLLLTTLTQDEQPYYFIYYPELKSFDYKNIKADIKPNISIDNFLNLQL